MPRLIIDDREIEVPEGTKVIDAAEALGIMIPRFCYHKSLGAVGACRLCAVKFLQGPVKGLQMSCMIDARDGMVVSTDHPEAVTFRRYVIEWLMMNHPHDCPVCDEGGHCLLQDETVSGGHGIRRWPGTKRTYRDQYLGPFVEHEMNRCIHCYRCSRFYQDFTGYRDLGAMQIANHVYFGRFADGPLESPFAGNLIEVCPTGVYTDRPSRYSVRRWDLERGPSVCIHCSLGCNTIGAARFREVMRQEARLNDAVNGWFICDRGRYGFPFTNLPERPRQALIENRPVAMAAGLREAARRLAAFEPRTEQAAVRCLGGPYQSLESLGALVQLCRAKGWPQPVFFADGRERFKVKRAVARLDERLACSLAGIEAADAVVAIGVDPIQEAPMLALAMRQAFRKGHPVVVLDPRPVNLPFAFIHIPLCQRNLGDGLRVLLREMVHLSGRERLDGASREFFDTPAPGIDARDHFKERLTDAAERLMRSQRPVLICGTGCVPLSVPDLAADTACLLSLLDKQSRLFYLLPGANSFATALLDDGGTDDLGTLIDQIEQGDVRGLIVVETDPFAVYPDPDRLQRALARLECLVAIGCTPGRLTALAHVFLPSRTHYETTAHFINNEGRVQRAAEIHNAGIPVRQETKSGLTTRDPNTGIHPPRVFRGTIPGGEPMPAWRILDGLAAGAVETSVTPWPGLRAALPALADAEKADQQRLLPAVSAHQPFETPQGTPGPVADGEKDADTFELLLTESTFGTEYLSSFSPILREAEQKPGLSMHPADAESLGLRDAAAVELALPDGTALALPLEVTARMARGVVIVPRHRTLSWQRLLAFAGRVPGHRLRAASPGAVQGERGTDA